MTFVARHMINPGSARRTPAWWNSFSLSKRSLPSTDWSGRTGGRKGVSVGDTRKRPSKVDELATHPATHSRGRRCFMQQSAGRDGRHDKPRSEPSSRSPLPWTSAASELSSPGTQQPRSPSVPASSPDEGRRGPRTASASGWRGRPVSGVCLCSENVRGGCRNMPSEARALKRAREREFREGR